MLIHDATAKQPVQSRRFFRCLSSLGLWYIKPFLHSNPVKPPCHNGVPSKTGQSRVTYMLENYVPRTVVVPDSGRSAIRKGSCNNTMSASGSRHVSGTILVLNSVDYCGLR
jgi:hypothetical protein